MTTVQVVEIQLRLTDGLVRAFITQGMRNIETAQSIARKLWPSLHG